MPAPRLLGSCALFLLSVGCTSGGIVGVGGGLTHAVAAQACGPTDGPAISIYLTRAPVQALEPPAPYVRIVVWQPLERLTERTWKLNGTAAEADGGAVYYTGDAGPEIATSGQVAVTAVGPDRTIRGFADLRFPTAGRVRGEFRATWYPRATICG